MREVHERLLVSDISSCRNGSEKLAVVHACKIPCHQRAVGYKGSLSREHPNYLSKEDGFDLYLNMIDPPVPLFMPPMFSHFLKFAHERWLAGSGVLIHCNQGESRAPSLALLFMAKSLSALSDESYQAARLQFTQVFPGYRPGTGIQIYLSEHWDEMGYS